MSERRGTKALETWCRRMSDGYPGVKVDNMTTSWRDGLAFCAIIHHFRPDLIDFTKLNKDNVYYNNNLAFRLAERHLGIPALLDAEDMVEYEVPDRLSILTYLSQFYQVLAPQASPTRIAAKRSAVSTDRSIVSSTSSSPATKMAVRPAGAAGSALGRREPCAKCALPVFLAERLNVGTKLYHRTCFRCARCNNQLSLANCYETEDGQYCCETCPDEEETTAKLPKLDSGSHKFDSSTSHNFETSDAPDSFSAKLSKFDSSKASSVVNQLKFDSSNDKSSDGSKKFDSFDLKQQRLDQVRNRSLSDEEKTKGLQQCEDDEYSASFEHALEEKVYEDDSLLSKARTSFLTSHLINEDHVFNTTTDINDTSNLKTVKDSTKTTTKAVKLIESYDEINENAYATKEIVTFTKVPLSETIKLSNDIPPPLPSSKPPDPASLTTTKPLSSASPLEPCVNKQLNTNQQTISDETTNLRMKNATKDDTNRSSLVKSRMLMFEEQTSDCSASLDDKTSIVSKYFSNSKKADNIVPLNKPLNILNISDNVNNSTKLAEDVSQSLDDSLELLTTFKKENIGRKILTKGDSASMSLVIPPNRPVRPTSPVLSIGDKGILLTFPSGTPKTVEESKIEPVISVGDTGIMLPITFGSPQLANSKNEEDTGIPLLPTSGRTQITMPPKITVLNRLQIEVMSPGTSDSKLSTEEEMIPDPIKEIESYLIAEETELTKVYKAIEELGSSIIEEETEVAKISQNIEELGSSIMGDGKITEIENTGSQDIEETTSVIKTVEDSQIPESVPLEFPVSILKFVQSETSELKIEEANVDSSSEPKLEDIIIHVPRPGLIEDISQLDKENIRVSSSSGVKIEEVFSTAVKEDTKPTPTRRCLLDTSLKQLSSEKLEEISSVNESHNFNTSALDSDETNKLNDSDIKRKLNSDRLVIESSLEENSSPKIQPRTKMLSKSILDNLSNQSAVSIDASLLNSTKSDSYPEDLNPFGDDEDVIPGTKDLGVQKLIKPSMEDLRLLSPTPNPRRKKSEHRKSSNPFDSDEDEVLTKPPLPKKPDVAKKLLEAPKINLNPFWSDDEHSEDDTPKPVPLPRTKPLGTPEPKPRPAELSKNSEKYHSNSSLSSLNSSFGGPSRKKKPAPLPPSNLSVSPQSSKQTSPCSSTQQSPRLTPKFRKTRKAPLPPSSTPVVNNRTTVTSTNLSPISGQPDIGTVTPISCQLGDNTKYFTPIGSDFESEKVCKDEKNRNRQSQMIPSPISDIEDVAILTASAVDKSMYGKWKRKKGPAPARPVPQRRQIKPLPLMELRRELDIIEMQQQGLEKQGVKLEQLIRAKCEGPDATDDTVLSVEVEDMVLELFELVNEKNELFRKQAELMYLRRQQRFEEEYADLEYQIRCLMDRPEQNKTDTDKAREEELISRLVEVVERRNEIVECLEMDRVREAEEDYSINSRLNSLASKRDEENTAAAAALDTPVKLSKKEKKKMKKDKKMKKKGENLDVDKDIDESETSDPSADKKKKKKKWFLH